MIKSQIELKNSIRIICDKEIEDLAINVEKNYHLSNYFLDNISNYNTANSLLEIYSMICNRPKMKKFFIDELFYLLSQTETLYKDTELIGISHLAFLVLLKIGNVDACLQKIKEEKSVTHLIPYMIRVILEKRLFDFSQLNLSTIKDFLIYQQKHIYNMYNKFVKDFISDTIRNIIITRYNNLTMSLKYTNLEINKDKIIVNEKTDYLGFDKKYSKLLDEIDNYIYSDSNDFLNAAMIGNLRVFMEDILKDMAHKISTKEKENIPKVKQSEMGNIRIYLKSKLELHDDDNKFIDSFVNILHHEGGHAFTSEKEYFRLARNFAIEFALFFLSKYEKLYSN